MRYGKLTPKIPNNIFFYILFIFGYCKSFKFIIRKTDKFLKIHKIYKNILLLMSCQLPNILLVI